MIVTAAISVAAAGLGAAVAGPLGDGPRTLATACAVIAGIEAVQMIRKGQVLGITKENLHGQAWIFGNLLGLN
jgi:hypothetical protein